MLKATIALCLLPLSVMAQLDSTSVVWMNHYGSGLLVGGNNHALNMTTDGIGNVIVTGYCEGSNTGPDFTTVKYDADGNELWTTIYDGPAGDMDWGEFIEVDDEGNVYVSGSSIGSSGYLEFATIKYSSEGAEIWSTRYGDLVEGHDLVCALALDESGHVYVGGNSWGGNTEDDYLTIKYNPDGSVAWTARYISPIGDPMLIDNLFDLVVDAAGHVIVTGHTYEGITTVKYAPDGREEWVATHSELADETGQPREIALDLTGNIYIAGGWGSMETAEDFLTLKYSPVGEEIWAVHYPQPGINTEEACALAVDSDGSIFVTGFCTNEGTEADYLTVKYDSDGNVIWSTTYNGPLNGGDWARDLTLDQDGNVYVIGLSYGPNYTYDFTTVKYDSNGSEVWAVQYDGPGNDDDRIRAVAVDPSGSILISGTSWAGENGTHYSTVKYTPDGNETWITHFGNSENNDQAVAMAVDENMNLYLTGSSGCNTSDRQFTTVKYNTDGSEAWATRYQGVGDGADGAAALAVDASGNVYVSGSAYTSGGNTDYTTIKLDPDGNEIWVAAYNGLGNDDDHPVDLLVDPDGSIFVTGSSWAWGFDYVTIKYDPNGNEEWVARFNRPSSVYDDTVADMVMDPAGNIYVTGSSQGLETEADFATVKYWPDGSMDWVAYYNGETNLDDNARAIAVDESGNIYVTGTSLVCCPQWGCDTEIVTIKYTSDGSTDWIAPYSGQVGADDLPEALMVNDEGDIYLAALSSGDCVIIKYDPGGSVIWEARNLDYTFNPEIPLSMTLDNSGCVYVTGAKISHYNDSYGPMNDIIAIKYSADGSESWAVGWGVEDQDDWVCGVAVDVEGSVYLAGTTRYELNPQWGIPTGQVFTGLKFQQPADPVSVEDRPGPVDWRLVQNFPNPFNPSTIIRYDLPSTSDVTLAVYDITGRTIATLTETRQPAGVYEIQWDGMDSQGRQVATGVYFARLTAGRQSDVIKMVYLR